MTRGNTTKLNDSSYILILNVTCTLSNIIIDYYELLYIKSGRSGNPVDLKKAFIDENFKFKSAMIKYRTVNITSIYLTWLNHELIKAHELLSIFK